MDENKFCIKKSYLVFALLVLSIITAFVFGRLSVTNNYSINSRAAELIKPITKNNESSPFPYFKIYKATKVDQGYKFGPLIFDGSNGKNFPLLDVGQFYYISTSLKGAPKNYFNGNDKAEIGMSGAKREKDGGYWVPYGRRPTGSCAVFSYPKRGSNYKISIKYFMRDKKLNIINRLENFVVVYFR